MQRGGPGVPDVAGAVGADRWSLSRGHVGPQSVVSGPLRDGQPAPGATREANLRLHRSQLAADIAQPPRCRQG